MDQVGFVRKLEGDQMELEIRRVSACGGNCGGCGSSCESTPHTITIENKLDAKVGDVVEIKGNTRNILKFTAIVYILPLAFLILGIVLGNNIFMKYGYTNYEILSFFTGIVFLCISFLILKVIDKKIANKKNSTLSVTRIL